MKLFDLALQLNGYPLKSAERFLKEIQNEYSSNIMSYQENQRREILDYHLKNNPNYINFVGGKTISNWEEVPILTKRLLQRPLNERISKPYKNKKIYQNKTSGSTGDPFIFAKDKFCHALTWAVIKNRFGWHNIDLNNSNQARFYGIPKEFVGRLKEQTKDYFSKRKRFSIFDLSKGSLEKTLNTFKETPFEYINGYTTAIVQFAKFLEERHVLLKEVCPSLKVCIVTSEMLFEKDRQLMQKQFGIKVINEYGASELDLIAFEDKEQNWRINWETLFVEIVDDNGKMIKNGEIGKVLITSLYNKAHPLIRYEIGDLAAFALSDTDFPVLDKLVGRSNDLVTLPSGKTAAGLTLYYVTKSLIEENNNVKEFIIEQISMNEFNIIYVSDKELNSKQFEKIKKAMSSYLEPNLHYKFFRKDFIERQKSGKLKQFNNLTLST
ncbi:phenylacetate--CoA ligase family protein [Aegicerativicinus sediminis]|uniref:phenylacetate--CoA ligase family protein n=1 Tax=Aegicerativicinus sediminis TaxID=2893202 RepID=UPI001E4D1A0F|nr:phenylacetate--CoA ligase family protein [Aegicerativicinus sediminis]